MLLSPLLLFPSPDLESVDKNHDDSTHSHFESCWDRPTERRLFKEGPWVKVNFSLANNFPRHGKVDSASVFTGRRAKLAPSGASPRALRNAWWSYASCTC